MIRILIGTLILLLGAGSIYAFTDSLWIVGRDGVPGGLVPVEVWLQYEGGGPSDSLDGFDIPLTWDACVCTVETITIGAEFGHWHRGLLIDNVGTDGPPPVPKILVEAWNCYAPIGCHFAERGTHLAGTVDFRILDTAAPSESTCLDTLMKAFSPSVFLGFGNKSGTIAYIPSFSPGCIRVVPCTCGDCNGDGKITVADALYTSGHIYRAGDAPACEGDVNQDGRLSIADAIYLLTYIYRNGPEPCNPSCTEKSRVEQQ